MAQRRVAYRARRISRRLGFNTGPSVAAGLMILGCLAGGVGLVGRLAEGGVTIERGVESTSTQEPEGAAEQAAGDAPVDSSDIPATERAPDTRCIVHVDGAVAAPGVVEVEGQDVRVYDAVEAAGGLLEDADTSGINLAEPLMDGAKIHIPHEGEVVETGESSLPTGQVSTVGATGSGTSMTLVNLNTATAEELQTLPGIGEVTAQTIIDERERNGPFATPEDLMRVSGIGEKKFEKVREQICV